jgi:hypothetical protein
MSAAVIRLASFVALAVVAGGLWVALFRSTGGTVTATPAIPSFSSKSVFAPASPPRSGLSVSGVVQNDACTGCTVHVGSGGLVRAQVPSGGGRRTAYALLHLANRAAGGEVLVHDVIGFGRGETPARRIALLQLLDVSHRLIFELVARPDRRLYLTSPAGGLRAAPLVLATGAIVPNDGISGVAVDVALKTNGWLLVSVNGVRTAAVRRLAGARTGAPRFLAAGVIGYKAPPSAGAITATHAQVSVSTPPTTVAEPSTQPTVQPAPPAPPVNLPPPLSSLSPPTISGTAIVGETLTAAPGTWSDGTATFTYVWESCDGSGSCTAIDGAEGRTYDLVRADRGAFVRVRVTAHVGDAVESRTSGAVGPVTVAAPTALRAPSISGAAVVGATLTADPGSWSDPDATFTFAWQRCDESGVCETIDGAVGESYDVTSDDLGSSLLVEVTASNSGGVGEADSVPTDVVVPAVPSVVTPPAVTGDMIVGSTVTVDPGTWSDPAATFTYAWLRCHGNGRGSCTTIEGVDGKNYVLTGDDVGFRIGVSVTAMNAGGSGSADSSLVGPVVAQAPPSVVTLPSVSGDAIIGSVLTADPGTWSDPAATFAYAWLRCEAGGACATIDGASGTTYTLTADDLGSSIGVEVTATGVGGSGTVDSSLVGPVVALAPPSVVTLPSVSGDAIVGSILTADPGTWSDPAATLTYAWLRCHGNGSGSCMTIEGADGTTYTLVTDDLHFLLRVEVTAANAGGTATALSTPTPPVVSAAETSSAADTTPSGTG